MQRLFQLQEQLLNLTPMKIVRQCASKINWDQQLIAIRGARGVGKSTIIRQYIRNHYAKKDKTALYCSLDANYFVDHSILDLAEQFYRMGGKHLFLDEIHKYINWGREIKEINDYYPDLKVVISGSSLLSLTQGEADLSRRCMNYDIPGLSFREYLQFYEGIDLPTCSLEDFKDLHTFIEQIYKQCKPMAYFDNYLKYGYYPYYKNNPVEYYALINNVVRYVIEEELPRICKVELENTRKIRALMNICPRSTYWRTKASCCPSASELMTSDGWLPRARVTVMVPSSSVSTRKSGCMVCVRSAVLAPSVPPGRGLSLRTSFCICSVSQRLTFSLWDNCCQRLWMKSSKYLLKSKMSLSR